MTLPSPTCPQCGASLPADAPAGLCPACLMNAAVPTHVDPGATLVMDKPKARDLPHVGETFGGYRIERELGHGGMGAVYAAEHLESGRRVALKVLSRQLDSPDARARFLREGRLAASINHPNSVYVFGTEEIEGTPVISMELIAGGTLQERVQRSGPLPVGEAVDAALQIIAGLEAAQAIGILHRDIKPANCFEDTDGTVKIGDFGLSISTQARGESHLTLPGDFLGTPAFCSPEQLRGDELNVRSDMYAVGVTLFYLLTGRTPFEGKNMVQLLANALEKSAPSPSQFRAEIPQSLSNVVLRCLEKLPASRFGSYEDLRRALTPFGSAAPTPATLGLRFGAMIIDGMVLGILNWVVMFFCFGGDFAKLTDPGRFETGGWQWFGVGLFAMQFCYWGVLEGVWGASVGKALVGLRVARLNRSAPGIPRAMARHLILIWPGVLIALLFNHYYENYDTSSRATQITSFLLMSVGTIYQLTMFVTARRHNGFAAVHDLLTRTRVVQKSAYQPRTVITQDEAPVANTEAMPTFGPYHLLTELSKEDEASVSLGYDTRLLRRVWIRRARAGEPPVPVALRNVGRPGRLRWLQGERNADEAWDAYEAVTGAPLVNLLHERQPWSSVRHWMADLAAELEASQKDEPTRAVPTLDRVWITSDGRAKLLNFSAPGAVKTPPSAPTDVSPRAFLNQVAMSALEGRIASREEASSHVVSAPLPLRARACVRDLITGVGEASPATAFKTLLQEKGCVSRWKRAAMPMVIAALMVMFVAAAYFGVQMSKQFSKSQPEFTPLMTCLLIYQDMERGNYSRLGPNADASQKAAMEIHIASHYGHVIRDPQVWNSPMFKSAIKPEGRALAERITSAHPSPSAEEVSKADATLEPLLTGVKEGADLGETFKSPQVVLGVIGLLAMWLMAFVAIMSLVCALVFRRGPVFRTLGVAAVTADGSEASRLRMLIRGLIAWSPALLGALLLGMSLQGSPSRLVVPSAVMAMLQIALVIASLIPKERGLQDKLAGTWLVPQ